MIKYKVVHLLKESAINDVRLLLVTIKKLRILTGDTKSD